MPPATAPECVGGALRPGTRACSLRRNEGRYAQQCAGGSWQDTNQCRCVGPVKVADAALRDKIAKALALQGALDAERAATVHELDLRRAGAETLEGLECFHDLERLWLDHNQIEDLSVLAQLPSLRKLSLMENRARDLSPLAGLTGLEELQASRNRILDLSPLESLANLESLGAGSNCIADLKPIANLTRLRNLSISFNYVASIAPLGGMTQMQHLVLSGNRFTELAPLARLYELQTLFIDSTGQRDLSALTELQRFNLIVIERNPIDCDAQAGNIRKLEENAELHGGRVGHDCTELHRKARREGRRDPTGLSTPVVMNKARDPRCAPD